MSHPISPKNLILDLLRVAPGPLPVRQLVEAAELFGIEGNALRVALTRLLSRGMVESDERGSYRLSPRSSTLARRVDAWRLGDARVRAWEGGWLAVWHPRGGRRGARSKSRRALTQTGFREGLEGLWVRPDNLADELERTRGDLRELGLLDEARLFAATDFEPTLVARWCGSLWDGDALIRGYREARKRLERSAGRLKRVGRREALVESFLLGGEAIRVLALDPLLPDAIVDGSERRKLADFMRDYDARGRAIWRELIDDTPLQMTPVQLAGTH